MMNQRMSIIISNYIDNLSNTNLSTDKDNVLVPNGANEQTLAYLSKLFPGQTLTGEVIGVDGNIVNLSFDSNIQIQAKLEQSIPLDIGQLLHFEVKGTKEGKISLSPLFENTAMKETVYKALEEANLPINDKTVPMVLELMKEHLSIDKQSIHLWYKELNSNPDYKLSQMISCQKLQIPITPQNMDTMQLYQEKNYPLWKGMETIIGQIPEVIEGLIADARPNEVVPMLTQLWQSFTLGESIPQEIPLAFENELNNLLFGKMTNEINGQVMEPVNKSNESLESISLPTKEEVLFNTVSQDEGAVGNKTTIVDHSYKLEQAIRDLLTSDDGKEKVTNIFRNKMFEQWLLTPDKIEDKQNIIKAYERMIEGTKKLTETLQELGKDNTPIARTVTTLQNNVMFLHDLNHTYTYLQLPLMMQKKNTNSELFVYTNKKNLAQQEGKITAQLYLDMEHLGAMNIFLSMENQVVSTNFKVEKEEYLLFIEKHLEKLNGRIQKRGYQITSDVSLDEKIQPAIAEIFENVSSKSHEEIDSNGMVLAQYSFDVRA